ncbi:hypothetical protein CMV00_01940 [Elizabethkingia anophelis]|nr:hypothetical protein [Elizabethkingia anophelis]
MNYLELLHKFWEYNQNERLGTTMIAMYLFLLEEWDKNEGNDFKVSDIAICEKLLLTRPTVKVIKEKLRNCGLIYYETQNGLPSHYRIILDYTSLRKEERSKKGSVEMKQKSIDTNDKLKTDFPDELPAVGPVFINSTSPEVSKSKTISSNKNIPTLTEFIGFAKTLPTYDTILDSRIQDKYESWVNNGWRTMQDNPITKWEPLLKATMPFILKASQNGGLSLESIPNIRVPKPKSTYDE